MRRGLVDDRTVTGEFVIRNWNFGGARNKCCWQIVILLALLRWMAQCRTASTVWGIPFPSSVHCICYEQKQNTFMFVFTLHLWKCMFWQKLFVCLWWTPHKTISSFSNSLAYSFYVGFCSCAVCNALRALHSSLSRSLSCITCKFLHTNTILFDAVKHKRKISALMLTKHVT